jgi:2'-hydroxyisoflavone reductase
VPGLFPEVERLVGDRRGDLEALRGRRWDAVIDTAAYVPSVVERAAALLAPSVGHYTLVSTRSVYSDAARSDEDGPVETLDAAALAAAEAIRPEGRALGTLYGESYGGLKVLCERAAEAAMPGRVLVLRPGLIVGPFDSTDRFTYWVRRVAEGGDVLAPGRPSRTVRAIDARDLAAFCVRQIEAHGTGVFNAAGADGVTMEGLLETCRRVSGSSARFVWAGEAFLTAQGVEPWSELPLWVPEGKNAFLETGNAKAEAAGLVFRALDETVRDTLAWDRTRGGGPMLFGITRERERELLARLAG